MTTFVTVIHILVCLLMIIIILVFQQGKGADAGAAFGGASQAMFGGRGSATFMNKVTTIAAIIFMSTSLSLAVLSSKSSQETVFDSDPSVGELVHPEAGDKETTAPDTEAIPEGDEGTDSDAGEAEGTPSDPRVSEGAPENMDEGETAK